MSSPRPIPPLAHQLSLVLHTAVDYSPSKCIGIGILRSAARGSAESRTLPAAEQAHGIERRQVAAKNVKTRERAHMYALTLALGLARCTIERTCTTARIKVQSVTVLCSSPAVVELIKYRRAHGPASLESVVSAEDRAMVRKVVASVKRLARCNVQVAVLEDGAEGRAVDAARVKMMAHQRRRKDCRRRRHERRIMAKNAATVGDEEGNGVGDGEETRNESSHLSPMTERELSSKSTMDETGEPELHWPQIYTPCSSASPPKQPTNTKRAEPGSPISRPLEPPTLQALPCILVHRTRANSGLVKDAEIVQNA
jgi:hypothetical protein